MRKKILVFGASGFMGTYLIDKLAQQNYEVFASDLNEKGKEFCRERDVTFITIDITKKKDFKQLEWFIENLAKDKPFIGIVLYSGNLPLSFGQNLWAIPISVLWPSYLITT